MIERITTNQIQDFLEKSSPQEPSSIGVPPNDNADVSLRVNYASLIEKAVQVPKTDARVVQRAQELLLAGRLDSPENAREAAENIIKLGI